MYAAELARRVRAREPSAVIAGFGGGRLRCRGRRSARRLQRPVGDGTARSGARPAAHLRDVPPPARGGARDRPDVFVAVDFPDFNFRLARSIRASACRSSTTSAHSSGRGVRGDGDDARARRPRARDLSLRGTHLPGAGVPGAVGRASAPRRHAAAAAGGRSRRGPGLRPGADRRAPARQPPQRGTRRSCRISPQPRRRIRPGFPTCSSPSPCAAHPRRFARAAPLD